MQRYAAGLKKLKKSAKKNKEPPPLGIIELARDELLNTRENLPALFTLAIEPKIIVRDFNYPDLLVFDSAKRPLRLVGINE